MPPDILFWSFFPSTSVMDRPISLVADLQPFSAFFVVDWFTDGARAQRRMLLCLRYSQFYNDTIILLPRCLYPTATATRPPLPYSCSTLPPPLSALSATCEGNTGTACQRGFPGWFAPCSASPLTCILSYSTVVRRATAAYVNLSACRNRRSASRFAPLYTYLVACEHGCSSAAFWLLPTGFCASAWQNAPRATSAGYPVNRSPVPNSLRMPSQRRLCILDS